MTHPPPTCRLICIPSPRLQNGNRFFLFLFLLNSFDLFIYPQPPFMYSSFLDLLLIKSDFILLLFGIISLLSKLRANFLPAYLLFFCFTWFWWACKWICKWVCKWGGQIRLRNRMTTKETPDGTFFRQQLTWCHSSDSETNFRSVSFATANGCNLIDYVYFDNELKPQTGVLDLSRSR